MEWEIAVLNWFQTWHNPALDEIMKAFTFLARYGWFWITIAVIFLCMKKTRVWGLTIGVALILCVIVGNFGLKPLFHRIRPYDAVGFTGLIIPKQTDYSFPSGHTQASFAAAFVLWYWNKKWGSAALVIAALIACSRMYLYMHYPTDVLGGFVVGTVMAVLAVKLVKNRWLDSLPAFDSGQGKKDKTQELK